MNVNSQICYVADTSAVLPTIYV